MHARKSWLHCKEGTTKLADHKRLGLRLSPMHLGPSRLQDGSLSPRLQRRVLLIMQRKVCALLEKKKRLTTTVEDGTVHERKLVDVLSAHGFFGGGTPWVETMSPIFVCRSLPNILLPSTPGVDWNQVYASLRWKSMF